MARRKEDSLCESVRDYCFDLLFPELAGEVPPDLRRHAAACPTCRQRLADVKQLLGVLSAPQLHQHLFSRQLTRHFNLLGAKVRCGDIRQFLPFLADENLLMRIPTPVTVHCDQCSQCDHDVSTIASLMLTPEQLARLSGLFSHDYQPQPDDCPKFADSIKTLASLHLEKVDSEAARHICACRRCRTALYEERFRLKLQNGSTEACHIPCAAVKPVDMFDFVVPFGLDLHKRQYAKFTGVLADHLRQCPTCLERMRQLHNIIYTIDSRGDSGVTTIYQFAPGKRQKAMTNVSEQYTTWPIKVHASGPGFEIKPKPPLKSRLTQKLTQNAQKLKLKQLARATATAAAFIILIGFLFWYMPESQAVQLPDVYRAIMKAGNVCISRFPAGENEPWRTTWISRSNRIRMYCDRNGQLMLQDTLNKVILVKRSPTADVESSPLDDKLLAGVKKGIERALGVMPFDNISAVPGDAGWKQLDATELQVEIPNTEVYELSWSESKGFCHRWHVYLAKDTNLPVRIDIYVKLPAGQDYIHQATTVVQYLTEGQIMAHVEKYFGSAKGEPESGAAGIPPSIPALSP